MPRKKVLKKKELSNSNRFDIQKLIKSSESYKSLIYGIITVVVLAVVVFLGVNTLSKNKAEITDTAATTQQDLKKTYYVVMEGESLWSIAEVKYGDGFSWGEIAKANNITDPTKLEKGTKLTIPEIAKKTVTLGNGQATTQAVNNPSTDKKIAGNEYTVLRNDNLWEIAVRAYGDGYRWLEIAKANNLANPNLIFSGNALKIPRP